MTSTRNFIIGGTEKSGTTSVFSYLSQHPQVCGSNVKETDFFRNTWKGDVTSDEAVYAGYFEHGDDSQLRMEASPGYLAAGEEVIGRMHTMLPDTRLLFMLRDPADRLYSSYSFHVSKLNIPEDVSFEKYIESCLRYDRGESSAEELGIGEWYLKALSSGDYFRHLSSYRKYFSDEQIMVVSFDDLASDVRSLMKEVCDFIDIDASFYDNFEFRKVNVTFSSKNKLLHKFAMLMNERSERFLRQRPGLKQFLVGIYKSVNQEREGYDPMSDNARSELNAYYRQGVIDLRAYLSSRGVDISGFDWEY